MTTIRIAGVPEHFNLPWHLAIENGDFKKEAIDLQWTDVPEGTGKMCQMLRNNETDIAIILTEGIVKSLLTSTPSHPHGIKIMTVDKLVGRVVEIVDDEVD